jgi:hypothetical protein
MFPVPTILRTTDRRQSKLAGQFPPRHIVGNMRDSSVRFNTPYAVLLTNGAAHFGHLSGHWRTVSRPDRSVLRRESDKSRNQARRIQASEQRARQKRQGTARARSHVPESYPDSFRRGPGSNETLEQSVEPPLNLDPRARATTRGRAKQTSPKFSREAMERSSSWLKNFWQGVARYDSLPAEF